MTPKKIAAIAAIFAVGFLSGSAHKQNEYVEQHLTQEKYVVQPDDTFWDITTRYCGIDQRGKYLLEYQDEIRRLNPELAARKCQLQPGDVISVRYYKE